MNIPIRKERKQEIESLGSALHIYIHPPRVWSRAFFRTWNARMYVCVFPVHIRSGSRCRSRRRQRLIVFVVDWDKSRKQRMSKKQIFLITAFPATIVLTSLSSIHIDTLSTFDRPGGCSKYYLSSRSEDSPVNKPIGRVARDLYLYIQV